MPKMIYGAGVTPDNAIPVKTISTYTGTPSPTGDAAQLGGVFVGNIITEVKLKTGSALTISLKDDDGNVKARLTWLGNASSVTIRVDNTDYHYNIVPDTSVGLARIGSMLYVTQQGLAGYLITDDFYTSSISIHFNSVGPVEDIKAGYAETDEFDALTESLNFTSRLYPEDKWATEIYLDKATKVERLEGKCPISVCHKSGNCLRFVEFDKAMSTSQLQCDTDGFNLCHWSFGIIEDSLYGSKHLLVVDGSRGYLSGSVNADVTSALSEYVEGYGAVFKIVTTPEELEQFLAPFNIGIYVDIIVLDQTDPTKPKVSLYRSVAASLTKIFEMGLDLPSSLASHNVDTCNKPIVGTYMGRDLNDSCSVVVTSVCTGASCTGWMKAPDQVDLNWKFEFRVQGDIEVQFATSDVTTPTPSLGFLSLVCDIDTHTLTVNVDDATHQIPLNVSLVSGQQIVVCKTSTVITVSVDGIIHYRTLVEEDTPPLWIWSNPGDLSKALVDPRLNGAPVLGWLGDEAHEELTGCGDNNVDLVQDVIVKDLYPSCDAGKMYYRELTKTLLSGETAKMLKFPPEVYRGFLDIYIENKNTFDLVVSVYMANTSTPYPKDVIAPQVRILPNDTYERKAQPMIKGETLFVTAFNGSASVLIQTVEETYK